MAENVFPYGSFGRAIYDPDEKEWVFQRDVEQNSSLRQIWSRSTPRPEGTEARHDKDQHHQRSRATVQKHVKGLSKTRPEIEPALDILASLNQVSQAVQHVSPLQDPICSSLISNGQVFIESSRRYTSAIAHACGPTGNRLRIVTLANGRYSYNGQQDGWLLAPTPRGEEVTWAGKEAPIRQILFSRSGEGNESLLAVRYPTDVLIFRPVFLKNVLRQDGTLLSVGLLSELPPAHQNQTPLAHLAFNPWYSRQFATIDQAGTWRIWNLEGRKHTSVQEALKSESSSNLQGQAINLDGWARVAWLQNPNTILVCTRLEAKLYDISVGPQYLQTINLEASFDVGWILDALVLTTHLDHAIILTSTHLVLLKAAHSLSGDVMLESICSIRHFLNVDEPSFNIETASINKDSILLVIRSANLTLVSYTLSDLGKCNVRLSSPATIRPSGNHANCELADCAGFVLQSASIKNRSQAIDDDLNLGLHNKSFISATILQHDLMLSQVIFSVGCSNFNFDELHLSTSDARLQAKATRAPTENFVVVDDDQISDELLEERHEPLSVFSKRMIRPLQSFGATSRSINYEFAAQNLVRNPSGGSSQGENVINSIQSKLVSENSERSLPWRTLRDYGGLDMASIDIETASIQLLNLKSLGSDDSGLTVATELDESASLRIHNVQWPHETQPSTLTSSLTEIYDSIVSSWISPLPNSVTGRIRLSKDRLARRMASDITLASRIIGHSIPELLPPTQQVGGIQTWDLPLRGPGASQTQQLEHERTARTQSPQSTTTPPPLPTPRTTPSVITGSSSLPSTFSAPEMTRLAHYTSFSNTLPMSLPRSIAHVLSHWQPGTDPENYDWLSSRNRLTQQVEAEEADSQLTERDRRRLQKQAEKLLKKQRKENKSSQDHAFTATSSQQWPEISVSASQQLPAQNIMSTIGGNFGSSQSFSGGGGFVAPASQVVRGRFGGRGPPVKKKRKQGF